MLVAPPRKYFFENGTLAGSCPTGRMFPSCRRLVLASRLQLGNIRPVGQDPANVPFSKKYFLGGATSIRGWGRYEVSPLVEGLPVGGNSMLSFSEELRAVIRGNF